MLEMTENNEMMAQINEDGKETGLHACLEKEMQKSRSNQATTLTGFFLVAVVFALDAFAVAEALLGQ